MKWDTISFDWNQVRAFLATAEEGSLSAAARALGLTQPTVSRQVLGLEEALGVVLFERGAKTLLLTDAGREVLEHVRVMGEAASRVSLTATGQSETLSGMVSVTATNIFATLYLPKILVRLREIAPGICVNIIASNAVQDLTQREADISIRHARPEQPDLIGRLIGETTANLYASASFLDAHGRPRSIEDLSSLPLVGFETVERVLPYLKSFGLSSGEEQIVAVSTSGTVIVALARAGLGMTFLTEDMGSRFSDLELVYPDFEPVPVPIWLVTHRELHTSKRIRLVFDLIGEEMKEVMSDKKRRGGNEND
ncbi:MAG: LysR family transcriptional regulator [Pseudomonadota bacterium]